jgi:hypothetical protein
MQVLKQKYVGAMQSLATLPQLERVARQASGDSHHSMRKWVSSLFAIYDTERMVALDCPWWNVAATRDVERFLASRPGARVFEYGSGASTAWLAKRAAEIVSIEHDRDWAERVRAMLSPFANATLLHRPIDGADNGYVNAVQLASGPFDLIVVDGRKRSDCLFAALPYLKPDGWVLFDDSGRKRYRGAIESCGLKERHFLGLSYCVPYPDHSSILSQNG